MVNTVDQQQRINQQQVLQQQALKPSEQLKQKGITGPLTQEQAAQISVFLPGQMTGQYSATALSEIKYGVEKGNITQEDYDKAVNGENMSSDGQTAWNALKEQFQVNWSKLLEFFTNNDNVGENGESLTEEENAKIDELMMNETFGFITEEELAEVDESLTKEEEAEEEEEKVEEEAPPPMEDKGDREGEVNAAFDAFLSDLTEGREFDAKNHPGISEADYNGIVSDFKDNGIIGDGDRLAQFESDNISPRCGDLAAKAKAAGKNLSYTWKDADGVKHTQRLKGIYDNDDNRYTFDDRDSTDSTSKTSTSNESSENDKTDEKRKIQS